MKNHVARRQFLKVVASTVGFSSIFWFSQHAYAKPLMYSGGRYLIDYGDLPTVTNPVTKFTVPSGEKYCWISYVDQSTFPVLDGRCTQDGCLVRWHGSTYGFICPFCGSSYDNNGSVQLGPAPEKLRFYDSQLHIVEEGPRYPVVTESGTKFVRDQRVIGLWIQL